MYPVSEAFLQAVQENTRRFFWTGRITTKAGAVHTFGNEDIVKGSGYISSQCCGSTEIEIGTVYAAEMGIMLFSEIDRYTLEDAQVELSYHLRLAGGNFEEVPMGIFEVTEANRTLHCLEIKAYDYMLRFERSFNGFETVGNAYDFLTLCCKACKVELAHTRAEIEAMPNGAEMLSVYTENDIETYRDVLFYVGQVLGGFFCINREGKLELRKYENVPVMTVSDRQRFSSSFSDFITRYTAVSSTNIRTQTAEYYGVEPDDGLTMNLGVNPLLQFGLEETRKVLLENILSDLLVIRYVPFDSDTIGNPALDLGDALVFSGGHADETQMACVTGFQIKINGKHSLKCVGKNPRLAQAKSKNDKNISGLLNQIEAGKIGIHTFTNASAYSVGDMDTKIISIEFAAAEETHVQFFAIAVVVPIPAVAEDGTETTNEVSVEAELPVAFSLDGKITLEETIAAFRLSTGIAVKGYAEKVGIETMELVQRQMADRMGRTAVGVVMGGFDGLLYALIVFVVVDYVTGVMVGILNKELSSQIGFRGIFKKVVIFSLVAVEHIIDTHVIGNGSVLRTAVIFFYLSNEGISILENAVKIGLPIPEKLKSVLEQLKEGNGHEGK